MTWRRIWGAEVQLHPFLTSELYGGDRSNHTPATVPTGNSHDTHLIQRRLGAKTGLDFFEKKKSLVSIGIRNADRPARSLVQAPLGTNTTYSAFSRPNTHTFHRLKGWVTSTTTGSYTKCHDVMNKSNNNLLQEMRNLDERTKNKEVLKRANLNVFKSETNFLYLRLPSPDIRRLFIQPKSI